MELVELFGIAVQSPQWMARTLDCLFEIGYQHASSYVKEILKKIDSSLGSKW
jgi:hypothetical protein